MFVPLTPLAFKRRAVALFGNKIGVVDGERRFTYQQFGERSGRLGCALLDRNLEPDSRVACIAFNSAELLEAYFGVLEVGCILLPINIRLTPHEIAYILDDAGVSTVLVDSELSQLWLDIERDVASRPGVVWIGEAPEGRDEPTYEELLRSASETQSPEREIDENEVAELFYTSGTTGRPKGVMLTHRNLYLHALSTLTTLRTDDSDVLLHTIPLFHVNGWGTPQSVTAVGGTHVMVRRFDPAEVLRLIEMEGTTRFFAVPTMLNMLLNHPELHTRDLSSLRLINTGGASMPPDMVRRAEEAFGCPVFSGYGLSETSPVLTLATTKQYLENEPADARNRRQATAGMPLIGVDVKIVDDNGHDLPWDGSSAGEIVVRGNVVMAGYWNDSHGTDDVMRGGWFHTGDIATIDPEGYVLIVDRKKDIIISGGENISSVEIEKILYEHPAVLETAVIGIPDEQWGEVPLALLVLRPNHTAGEEDILSFCRSRLAGFKLPKRVEFLPELPKGGTGKVLKARLREPYWSAEERRVH